MTSRQKLHLWEQLVKIGFKEIEVGFPSASGHDYEFVRELIDNDRIPGDVTIQVLVQAREELVKRTFEALRGARRAIVHVYNSTSTVQREQVFGLDRAGIVDIAVKGAALEHIFGAFGADQVNMQTQNLFMEINPNRRWYINVGLQRNYDNIADPKRLSGSGTLTATWDLRLQSAPHPRRTEAGQTPRSSG